MPTKNWTIDNIADLSGKRVLITGGTSGIGLETARVLSLKNAEVILTARSVEKGAAAVEKIKGEYPSANVGWMILDLSDLDSIQAFSEAFHAKFTQLDRLINNAGVMYPASRETTKQNFELQFGTNHLGHFALTALLFDLLKATPESRITTQSSIAHTVLDHLNMQDLNWEKTYNRTKAYSQSKLANLLFTYELDRQIKFHGLNILANAAHPGVTNTNLFRTSGFNFIAKLLTQRVELGALPILRAATEPNLKGAEYFGPKGIGGLSGYPIPVSSSSASHNESLAKELWTVSEQLTGKKFVF
ncbi:MAG TPA: oxidoreductase [Bacteroidales bacterium]|nr:oxidoreductase [Bacteroidales bacterium]